MWVGLAIMVIFIINIVRSTATHTKEVDYSLFREYVRQGLVESVTIEGSTIAGKFKDVFPSSIVNNPEIEELRGKKFTTVTVGTGDELIKFLEEQNLLNFAAKDDKKISWYEQLFISILGPLMLFFLLLWFFSRQIQAGGSKTFNFGKSKAKLLMGQQQKVNFKDVAGIDEAKDELEEIIAFLKDPKKFTKLGGRIPKGVLLVGAPGTGKTLLARAIAGEAGVPFFSISGSDFVEMFVGVGASRVRDLFEQGKKHAPCIIFIDEIDAVGRQRGAGLGGGHDEREQTLNQLLVEMDGFESNEGVIIISATNRPDVLDPALLRPGRFDRRVVVPRPDLKGRHGIFKVHTRKMPLSNDVHLEVLARGTPGFSGADIENMVNEAALLAARYDKKAISMTDFEIAKDKVLLGTERKSMIISESEKKQTAFHEAGHTLVAKMLPGTDPIHKVTIIPRGMALGVTQLLPEEDKYNLNQEFAENEIAYMMGGRAAEELVFDTKTTGAGNDLERATELAHKMVCDWGMSEKLGPLSYGSKDEQVFLGRDFTTQKNYSEKTAQEIDQEIRRIVVSNYERAKEIIKNHMDKLHKLAEALLEYEALDGYEVQQIIDGNSLKKKKPISENNEGNENLKDEKTEEKSVDTKEEQKDVPGGVKEPQGAPSS